MFVEITNTDELKSLADDPKPPKENKRTGMYISEILPCNVCLLHTVALSLLNYLNQYCCVNIIYLLEQKIYVSTRFTLYISGNMHLL